MRIFFSLLVICSLSACSFSVPSAEEQKQLVQDKNFVAGTPAWFVNSAGGQSGGQSGMVASNGIIPSAVAPLPSLDARTAEVQYPMLVRSEEIAKAEESKPVASAKSSLERISQQCSASESEVNTALTNIDRESKIKQYEALTKKCPMSADLQLWLSQEYLKVNKLIAARSGFEQVLVLDPTNEDAKAGIAKSEKLLSAQ